MAQLSRSCELCQTTQHLSADKDIKQCIDARTGRTTFYIDPKNNPKHQPQSIEDCPIRLAIVGKR